jgi:glycosyltransferase involved in cell wall biosynthesis
LSRFGKPDATAKRSPSNGAISAMRVLLNATSQELQQLGGDFTLYQDWRRLHTEGLEFKLLTASALRRRRMLLRKGLEKLCRTWQPISLRRRFFLCSRFIYMSQPALEGIDLVFSHLLYPAGTDPKIPIVWSSQGISPAAYYERYNRGQWTVEDVAWVYRELGRRADALVISTQTCSRNVVNWCPELEEKVHFVPGPVFAATQEASHKPSLHDGLLRILFVGIDAERKGLPEVVEAYAAVRERFSSIRIDIVSRPSDALQEKIAGLKDAQLHLSSPGVNVNELMERADIFLIPTHADTYALAAVEAMAHGCAIVISDLEPLPEVAPDGETGFVIPVGDARAIAGRLEQMVCNNELLRTFQINAKRRFNRLHAPEAVAARLNQVFEQVLRRRMSPSRRTEPIIAGAAKANDQNSTA